jgi:hypothetical protein
MATLVETCIDGLLNFTVNNFQINFIENSVARETVKEN